MAGREFKIKKGLVVYSEGVDDVVLDVQGSQGQLFSVTDRLTGLLHSVNDISGIPIMEVYSDDRILMGTYGANALQISGSTVIFPNVSTATTNTNKFLVLDGTTLKTRTSSELLSDIGAQGTLTNPVTGTGTTNYITKFTGTTTVGNSTIFESGGDVGIGNNLRFNSTNSAIRVYNTINTAGFDIGLLGGSSDAAGYIYQRANSDIAFGANNTEQVRLKASGNLLIGTLIDSGQRLQVSGNAYVSGNVGIGTASPDSILTLNGAGNSRVNFKSFEVRYGTIYSDSGLFAVSSIGALPLAFGTNDTERARITPSGNVGVGTTTPIEKLTISDVGINALGVYRDLDVNTAGTVGQLIYIGARNGTTFTPGAAIVGGLDPLGATGLLDLQTRTSNSLTTRVRITSGGNVLIGTTTDSGQRLQVNGDAYVSGNLRLTGVGDNQFIYGTGDGANYTTYNFALSGWFGMGLYNPTTGGSYPQQVSGVINFREGYIDMKGGFYENGTKIVKGSGTTNYIPKFTASGTIGNSLIFDNGNNILINSILEPSGIWSNARNMVFIKSSPSNSAEYILERNDSTIRANFFVSGTTNDFGLWTPNSANMLFGVGNLTRMMISANNNVLIGTTTDTGQRLQVSGTGYFTNAVGVGVAPSLLNADLNVDSTVRIGVNFSAPSHILFGDSGTAYWVVGRPASSDNFRISSYALSNVLEIQPVSGNVGIGTDAPTTKLQVVGEFIRLANVAGTQNILLQADVARAAISAPNGILAFDTAGSERARITSSGDVGIGTTNPTSYSGYTVLTLGGSAMGLLKLRSTYNSGNGFELYQNTSGDVFFNINSNDTALVIKPNGNALIGTTTDSGQKLQVNGTSKFSGASTFETDSHITFGPNSGWGASLRVGGNGNTASGLMASVAATNGNLHLDAAPGSFGTYLNYYLGTSGVLFGNGASGIVAVMGPDGDLWKGGADNTGVQYVQNTGTWGINITGTAAGLSSTLVVGSGGTGASTLTGVVIGNGTSAMTAVAGTASQLLRRNAGNTAYEFFTQTLGTISGVVLTSPTNGQVLQYNGTNWVNATPSGGSGTLTGTLTATRIPFATGTSTLSDDSGLVWDNSNKILTARYIQIFNSDTAITQDVTRLKVRSQGVDGVAEFASYGMFLPVTGQAYNLYTNGGINLGYNNIFALLQYGNGSTGLPSLEFRSGEGTARMRLTPGGTLEILTGNLTVAGQIETPINAKGSQSGTVNFNWSDGNLQSITLAGNSTFTFSNPSAGGSYQIIVTQNGTGGYTVTWPTIHWKGKTIPTLTGTANSVDVVTLTYDGTKYLGTISKNHGTP